MGLRCVVIIPRKRVFVSFDFDRDRVLKEFIIGQAKSPDSPFEVIDMSMKEAAPMFSWLADAELKIRRCELVIVVLGLHTYKAPGVLKEVAVARRLKKPIIQIIGYRNGKCTPVPDAGRVYTWNWENLKKVIRS